MSMSDTFNYVDKKFFLFFNIMEHSFNKEELSHIQIHFLITPSEDLGVCVCQVYYVKHHHWLTFISLQRCFKWCENKTQHRKSYEKTTGTMFRRSKSKLDV